MPEAINHYEFGTYGPFELPVIDERDINSRELRGFWDLIDSEHPGLSEAMGCYVFVVEREFSLLPWYVGKTEKRSFRFESVQPHKLLLYRDALKSAHGKRPLLFLLPRLTKSGKFRKVWTSGSASVDRLEGMLIEAALTQNPKIMNTRSIKHLTQTVVPGFCNDSARSRSPSAKLLARAFGTTEQNSAATLISKTIKSALMQADLEMESVFAPDTRLELLITYQGVDYDLILEPHADETGNSVS